MTSTLKFTHGAECAHLVMRMAEQAGAEAVVFNTQQPESVEVRWPGRSKVAFSGEWLVLDGRRLSVRQNKPEAG
jgi:hypothetical protein